LICQTLKKLSNQLQPYQEVARIIEEIRGERPEKKFLDIRVLEHLIAYAEHQFGDRVTGRAYRERGDSEGMDNWVVDMQILIPLYGALVNVYSSDESLSIIDSDSLKFPYYEKMLDLLKPWSSKFNSNSIGQIDSLDKDQINFVLYLLSTTERNIAIILQLRNEFILAESYCQQALSHARLYEGTEEDKTDSVCDTLRALYDTSAFQGNYIDALPFAEEAYNLVAIAYNPVHPKVQEAAGMLIDCLIHNGDLYNAERFAEATLDSLKDPANRLDQESEAVANGYHNLANVIHEQDGDLVKAEMLGRESLRIRSRTCGNDHVNIGQSCSLLARILMSQDNLGNETMELFERALAKDTKDYGPDGTNTAVSNTNLGVFYNQLANRKQTDERKMAYLHLSKSCFEEAMRIYTKIFGPNNPQSIKASSALSIILRRLSEA
jgi:tetratricopeptide (TPR) repeat protein